MSVFMRRNAYHKSVTRKRKTIYSEKRGPCLAPEDTGHYSTCWNVQNKPQLTKVTRKSPLLLSPLFRKSTKKMENTSWTSLTSKLKNHYNSSLDDYKKRRTSIFTPKIIEIVAVPMFFFTIIAAWLIGILDVLPKIYEESRSHVLLLQQFVVTLFFSEMMVNWFCIRYVDSSIKTIQGLKSIVKPVVSTDESRNGPESVEEEQSAFTVDSHGNRTYPYWSRTPCFKCDVIRPPRCHHCPLCNICILKRDHHCFFAGSCVGWRNQRHFVVFCLWASLSCSYAFGHALYYIYYELMDSISYVDLFAPITVYRCLFGYVSGKVTLYVTVTTFLLYFAMLSSNFFIEHMKLINAGKTSFEVDWVNKNLQIKDSRSFYSKLKGVLGEHVWLSVIFPVHFIFPPLDDPNEWPFVKVYRQP